MPRSLFDPWLAGALPRRIDVPLMTRSCTVPSRGGSGSPGPYGASHAPGRLEPWA
ncbi:hypothetical protein [Azohydromonas caseinilytica]|uniref:Uncharacterized protein n=1 Tax=Azohydromonas caseinilytica TaxID=2728836 RepID=A0A848FLA4_9BURK|nr:hypothetical protein [Azohydromonas caseinilytica]NML18581.1 hypothetical protein [Azohydromonas caseinilytica]